MGETANAPGLGSTEQGLQLLFDEVQQLIVGGLVAVRLPDPIDNPLGGLHPHIGLDQPRVLEIIEERLVDLAPKP